jgi:nucleolar GTP-binding protein
MRKVKFVSQTFHDRLTLILEEFPILDDLHPFYGDLLNVLYDRDHYKLALAQLNTARHLIDNLGQEYARFLKYGDSMYRCKQLKITALGRMCTIIKQQSSSFAYLEQVRQHLARLPSIDPSTRTIIMVGYPNVGKSSLMNKLTRANVDVQPYAFTTKSLFVGHMDYKYLKWQVLDTPGILDHPLEERNTIEMQAVTALAHLHSTVMFLLDISETCNYSIEQQVSLFNNLRPLFVNKPLILVLTKVDIKKYNELEESDRALIESVKKSDVDVMELSSLAELGIASVKEHACEKLLAIRTENKLKMHQNDGSILSRLHLAMPKKRDSVARTPVENPKKKNVKKDEDDDDMELPENSNLTMEQLKKRLSPAEREKIQEIIDAEKWANGEIPWTEYLKERERYMLANPEWRYDIVPEIMDGRNIYDYIDPDIEAKLKLLEEEEEERLAKEANEAEDAEFDELNEEEIDQLTNIRRRRVKAKLQSNIKRNTSEKHYTTRTSTKSVDEFADHLKTMGISNEDAEFTAKKYFQNLSLFNLIYFKLI